MPLLYLIRHPHTQVDLSTPVAAWRLSDAGRAQTGALAAARFWEHVAAVYPSTEPKAIRPAEAAARPGTPVIPLADLAEVDRTAYTAPDMDAYTAAVAAFLAGPDTSIHGWETAAHALARFRRGMADALSRHAETDTLAVITHGLVLTLYTAHLRGEPPSFAWWQVLDFAAVCAVDRATMQPLTGFLTAPYADLPLPG